MTVHSVTGPLPARPALGRILPHEHVMLDYGQMSGEPTPVSDSERRDWGAGLARLRAAGVGVLVDCTPPGYGRDLELLAELARASQLTIVASTGSFCEQWADLPADVQASDIDGLAARFVADLRPTSGPAAGVIKVATSHGRISDQERKVLTAAAAAHAVTNAPIVAHTTESMALEQLDLFAEHGVDLGAVLVSHVCAGSEPFEYAVEIARRGAYVGFDRIGHAAHGTAHWLAAIEAMMAAGLADRVLLSHDSVQRFTGPELIAAHTFTDSLHLSQVFAPALTADVGGEELTQLLMTDNPARWLTREETST